MSRYRALSLTYSIVFSPSSLPLLQSESAATHVITDQVSRYSLICANMIAYTYYIVWNIYLH